MDVIFYYKVFNILTPFDSNIVSTQYTPLPGLRPHWLPFMPRTKLIVSTVMGTSMHGTFYQSTYVTDTLCLILIISLKFLIFLHFLKVLSLRPSFETVQIYVKMLDRVLVYTYYVFVYTSLGNVLVAQINSLLPLTDAVGIYYAVLVFCMHALVDK